MRSLARGDAFVVKVLHLLCTYECRIVHTHSRLSHRRRDRQDDCRALQAYFLRNNIISKYGSVLKCFYVSTIFLLAARSAVECYVASSGVKLWITLSLFLSTVERCVLSTRKPKSKSENKTR
jgi:hypothetical protein